MSGLFLPVIRSSGPSNAKLMAIGEAPGETEEQMGVPFVGGSGLELRLMLKEAGLDPTHVYFTNVFWSRPENNKLIYFTAPKKEGGHSGLPALIPGRYILPELLPELDRLKAEIQAVKPNLILALGNTATWALLQSLSISKIRGAITECKLVPGVKVLPTFHPSNVLRQYENRPIVLQDLQKAKYEMEFPEIKRPERTLLIFPTIEEVEAFVPKALAAQSLSLDVETFKKTITQFGCSISPQYGISIPFRDKTKPSQNYWDSESDEVRAFRAMSTIVRCPVRKIFQNGLYDMQYFWQYGIPVGGELDDTMILHHSLYPELPKGLDFLGSIYTNEAPWKLYRKRDEESTKRDE